MLSYVNLSLRKFEDSVKMGCGTWIKSWDGWTMVGIGTSSKWSSSEAPKFWYRIAFIVFTFVVSWSLIVLRAVGWGGETGKDWPVFDSRCPQDWCSENKSPTLRTKKQVFLPRQAQSLQISWKPIWVLTEQHKWRFVEILFSNFTIYKIWLPYIAAVLQDHQLLRNAL